MLWKDLVRTNNLKELTFYKENPHSIRYNHHFKHVNIYAASIGSIPVLELFKDEVSGPEAMDIAAENGHLECVRWIHSNRKEGCTKQALFGAALNDHESVVRWILENYPIYNKELADEKFLQKIIQSGHLGMLQFICGGDGWSTKKKIPDTMINIAVEHGHIHILKWFTAERLESIQTSSLDLCAANENALSIFHWLDSYDKLNLTSNAMDRAAQKGRLDVLRFIYKRFPNLKCNSRGFDAAAANGHLDILEFLSIHYREKGSVHAVQRAMENGHAAVLFWLFQNTNHAANNQAFLDTILNGHVHILTHWYTGIIQYPPGIVNSVVSRGHLSTLIWLHNHDVPGFSEETMDLAARRGYLEIVIWLDQHRTEGCTVSAIDYASKNGHLEVVEWLHFHRTEGCTSDALDFAAEHGHLEILIWFSQYRSNEQCTEQAFLLADQNHHFHVLHWLYERYSMMIY